MDLLSLNPFRGALPLMDAGWLLAEKVELSRGTTTVGAFLQSSDTDALVVMKSGKASELHAMDAQRVQVD